MLCLVIQSSFLESSRRCADDGVIMRSRLDTASVLPIPAAGGWGCRPGPTATLRCPTVSGRAHRGSARLAPRAARRSRGRHPYPASGPAPRRSGRPRRNSLRMCTTATLGVRKGSSKPLVRPPPPHTRRQSLCSHRRAPGGCGHCPEASGSARRCRLWRYCRALGESEDEQLAVFRVLAILHVLHELPDCGFVFPLKRPGFRHTLISV